LGGSRRNRGFYNLPFYGEIATPLAGARKERMGKGFRFLNRDLGNPTGGDDLLHVFGLKPEGRFDKTTHIY